MSADLNYVESDAIVARGRTLYPGELACYSSHYAVWKRALQEDADQVLVLEDDVAVDWGFVRLMIDNNLACSGINYLKLFNKNMTPFKVLTDNFHQRSLIDCRGFAYGMQAYMLTRVGVECFMTICKTIRRPIDDEMDRSWAHGIPTLCVFPFPAYERYGQSTLGKDRYERRPVPTRFLLRRTAMRATEKFLRLSQRMTGYGQINSLSLQGDVVV